MSASSNPTWLVVGACAGYALMMATNPVRECLRDGWLAVRRYPSLWLVLGLLGFANALFAIITRAFLAAVLPLDERPIFTWMREAWRDPNLWLSGSPESLWWLPRDEFVSAVRDSMRPAIENVAGLFDCVAGTFPLSACVAVVILRPWRGRGAVLWHALIHRFGKRGMLIYGAVFITAIAAILKPFVYLTPTVVPPLIWMQWGQVVSGLAFVFEYLLGVGLQIFLLLLAYAWVRGLNFAPAAMIDVALRRFSCVLQWSALLLLLSVVLIEAPLILKNFPTFAPYFPETELFARWLSLARMLIALVVVAAAGVQVSLALHASSLRRAWREHLHMVKRAWWPLGWFLVIALFHCFIVRAFQENIARGLGEGTALWVMWSLASPWLLAVVSAWLLASWVCFYQRFARGEALPVEYTDEE